MNVAGNKTISMTLVAAAALQAGQSQGWQKVCACGFHPRTSLLRVSLWQRWDQKQLSRAGASAAAVRHLVPSEAATSTVEMQRKPSAAAGGG